MQVTLAKALNIKNRIAGELKKTINILASRNSSLEGAKVNFDLNNVKNNYFALKHKMISVKTAIAKANTEIYGKIYEIAETKNTIAELRSISTKEGKEIVGGRYSEPSKEVNYVSYLKDSDIEAICNELEEKINTLQDEVSSFNHTTKVEIPD